MDRPCTRLLALCAIALAAGACQSPPRARHATHPDERPAPAPADETLDRHAFAFPTGDRATSVLLVESFLPADVTLGRAFQYRLRVTNLTDAPLRDVQLVEEAHRGLILVGASPEPAVGDGRLRWDFELEARAAVDLSVTAIAETERSAERRARVTVGASDRQRVPARRPELRLEVSAVGPGVPGEPLPFEVRVTNVGDGTAHEVILVSSLPDGLRGPGDVGYLELLVDRLEAGATRSLRGTLVAQAAGSYTIASRTSHDAARPGEALVTALEVGEAR